MGILVAINVFETDEVKQHVLGQKYYDDHQDIWRYVRAGGTALTAGQLVVNADSDTDATNITVAQDYTAGQDSIVVDFGGEVAEGAFVDGTLAVNDETGEGHLVHVGGNTGTSGSGEATISLKDPLPVDLTADTTEVTLQKSPWDAVVVSATDQADMPVGVPQVDIAADEYGWVKTHGSASVLADTDGFSKGDALTIGDAVAGTVTIQTAGDAFVGIAQMAGVAGEYRQAFLMID